MAPFVSVTVLLAVVLKDGGEAFERQGLAQTFRETEEFEVRERKRISGEK